MNRNPSRVGAFPLAPAGDTHPRKLYYKIGEVCDRTGLTAHVLRYWEKEFPQLAPKKTTSGHRLYRDKDIQTVLYIKQLLYDQKFTIRGAREHLGGGAHEDQGAAKPTAGPGGEAVGRLHEGLSRLRGLLERKPPL